MRSLPVVSRGSSFGYSRQVYRASNFRSGNSICHSAQALTTTYASHASRTLVAPNAVNSISDNPEILMFSLPTTPNH